MAPKFSMGNIQFTPPYVGGAAGGGAPQQSNYWTPELQQLLGQMAPASGGKTEGEGFSKKKLLMEILPLLLSGGLGAAFGGSIGAGSALSTYGQYKQAREELKEKRATAQEAISQRQLEAAQRLISQMKKEEGVQKRHEESLTAAGARQKAGFEQEEAMLPKRTEQQKEMAKFQYGLGETPTNISGVLAAIQGKGGTVPGRYAGTAIGAITSAESQQRAQQAARDAAADTRTFAEAQQQRAQQFGMEQQGRALGVQVSEGEKNRALQREMRTLTLRNSMSKVSVPGDVQTHIEDLSSALEMLQDVEDNIPKISKLIGPAQSYVTWARQKVGATTAEEEEILSKVSSYSNQLLKARSGGAVTPQEAERFQQEIQSTTNTPEQFKGRLKTQKEMLKKKLETRLQMLTPQQRSMVEQAISGGATGSFGTQSKAADPLGIR